MRISKVRYAVDDAIDLRMPCRSVLDPAAVTGEAPPYFGQSTKGSQLWYGIFVPTRNVVERMEVVDFDRDGRNEISVWTSSRSVFYLSFDGMVQRVSRSDGASAG
jgi:hypothetical protein